MGEKCIIEVAIGDDYDREMGYELEDVVKSAWGYMVPWFTARHGIRDGQISLCSGQVQITWRYETDQIEEE